MPIQFEQGFKMNRRVGTMPSFAYPPKGAMCVEPDCTHPAVRMLISVKSTLSPPIASPACASCADAAISARRARLAGDGETYRLATGSAHGWPPKAPEPAPELAKTSGESGAGRGSTGPKVQPGQKDRSPGTRRR